MDVKVQDIIVGVYSFDYRQSKQEMKTEVDKHKNDIYAFIARRCTRGAVAQ